MSSTPKTNLLTLDRPGLVDFFTRLGEAPYRAQQITQWIHQYGVDDFSAMTNIGKATRERLAETAVIVAPHLKQENIAADGTRKWLFELDDGNCIETVFIPETGRGTLCVSSQVGCTLKCSFCATGRQGYSRNLTTGEIIGQLWLANRLLGRAPHGGRAVTNVVFMGMGEPLLNFDQVTSAIRLMLDDLAYGLAKRRVTVSTAGLVPLIDKLHATVPVSLAVSLHAPTDALRDELVPLNRKYPIADLLDACRRYCVDEPRRKITFEYVMLRGINDSLAHARALARLLRNVPAKVNLIPFNPFEQSGYERSSKETIDAFRILMMESGLIATTRKTRGDDIDAACGQLAGEVRDRTRRRDRRSGGVTIGSQ